MVIPERIQGPMQSKILCFIWNNKSSRINKSALHMPKRHGGLVFLSHLYDLNAAQITHLVPVISEKYHNGQILYASTSLP